jgi:hypothetical protein
MIQTVSVSTTDCSQFSHSSIECAITYRLNCKVNFQQPLYKNIRERKNCIVSIQINKMSKEKFIVLFSVVHKALVNLWLSSPRSCRVFLGLISESQLVKVLYLLE